MDQEPIQTMNTAYSDSLLERFCRYVRMDTQADEKSGIYPSSPGQLELGRMLVHELTSLGLNQVRQTEFGIVHATIPSTVAGPVPTIAFLAHLDTSPETCGHNVQPQVIRNYSGCAVPLSKEPTRILDPVIYPELNKCIGRTIITTDGTTLLGADNKAGVAVIMEAASYLVHHPEIPHGEIKICFTCDEEIGHGVDHLELDDLQATVAYTLDGGGEGIIEAETFSADRVEMTITGVNIHPAIPTIGIDIASTKKEESMIMLIITERAPEQFPTQLFFRMVGWLEVFPGPGHWIVTEGMPTHVEDKFL